MFQHQNGIEILKSKYIKSSLYQIGYFLANVLHKLEYIFDTKRPIFNVLQGQSRQTVYFDFDLMGTYYKIVLGFIGYKWALVMDISLSEAKMLKYQS